MSAWQPKTVKLKDGREVMSDSPEWRDECLERYQARRKEIKDHVANLNGLDREGRNRYVENLALKDSDLAEAVKAEVWDAYEKRRQVELKRREAADAARKV